MPNVPESFAGSPAFQFIQSRGWYWKQSTAPNIELETCPYCNKSGYGHCYMEIHGASDEQKNRDGLHICHRCGKGGRIADLKGHLGITIPGVESRKDYASSERQIEPLPDVDACHQALLEDADAMDYFMNFRGFSREIIEKQKIGIKDKHFFKGVGEVKAIVYPYLVNGNAVWVHYRTCPDIKDLAKVPKQFSSPKGWDSTLYNGEVLRDGLKEILLVEGEPNCIAAMDKGIENICGVPGANIKKAEWIDTLDKLELDKIFIAYDRDKVGQRAAQTLASRIGIERCWKIILPEFDVTTESGETRKGKDLNEWFTQGGGTADKLTELMAEAQLFDVDGVSNSTDAVSEFEDDLLGKGVEPRYKTQWPGLNKLVGFDPGDVIDILAPEKIGKTTFAMNLVEHMVNSYGEDGIIICLEMTRAKLARKWIAHKAGIADNIPNSPEEAEALKDAFLKAIPVVKKLSADRDGDLYFCLPKYKTTDDIYTLIRQVIRRYGVKWIVIDNLQRLADTTPRGNDRRSRTEHLSEISKVLSQIAKEYEVQMVRILQPHRIADGRVATSDNTDGSSQIAKDCDCHINLHRSKIGGDKKSEDVDMMVGSDQTQSFANETLCTVGLSRFSTGGSTWLVCDGARSTFNSFTMENLAAVQKEMNKDLGFAAQLQSMGMPTQLEPETMSEITV